MLIQINANVAATAQDSLHVQNFHEQTLAQVKIILIFGAYMSSSVHIDNKNEDIFVVGKEGFQKKKKKKKKQD